MFWFIFEALWILAKLFVLYGIGLLVLIALGWIVLYVFLALFWGGSKVFGRKI